MKLTMCVAAVAPAGTSEVPAEQWYMTPEATIPNEAAPQASAGTTLLLVVDAPALLGSVGPGSLVDVDLTVRV